MKQRNERFVVEEEPWWSEYGGFVVMDATEEFSPWRLPNRRVAEQAAELLNRGCRAEREDECLA